MAREGMPEGTENAAPEQLTIHDQAYWQRDSAELARFYDDYRGLKISELSPEQKDRMLGFMWRKLFTYRLAVMQLAVEAAPFRPRPVRKRAVQVPKAAMPETEGGPDAA